MEPRSITLAALNDGAAEELFQVALRRVLENLDDPNTHFKGKRRISLTLDFETDEERKSCRVHIACSTKLASARPSSTTLFVGRRNGELIAVEAFKQETMFQDSPGGKLVEFPPRKEDK